MNRRSFLDSVLKGGAAAAFLPSAITYARKWIYQPFFQKRSGSELWILDWSDIQVGYFTFQPRNGMILGEWVELPLATV